MKNKIFKNSIKQKGQAAFIVVFVIMSLLFFISIFLANAVMRQTKSTINALSSVQAFYLADLGAERILFETRGGGGIDINNYSNGDKIIFGTISNSQSLLLGYYEVKKVSGSPLEIKSSGVSKNTSRSIDLSWN